MPLYEYACEKCGKVFEVMQKFSDEPLTVHSECGGKVDRLLSAPALHFKGSGFYITDYAKSGSSKSPGKSEGGKSESGKDESKPDSSKANGSKSESSAPAATPAPATASSSSDSKS